MRQTSSSLAIALGIVVMAAAPAAAQSPKVYKALYTEVPPVIDGIETTPDEWSLAQPGGDQWLTLTSHSPDTTNNRFEVLWDDNGLYLRHRVDSDNWENRATNVWDPVYENLNLFFDPNTDGEPNENTEVFGTTVDGYHLAFNQPLGTSEINLSTHSAGSFSEAHVNALFVNNGGPFSAFAGIQMMQTTSVEMKFGYTELFVPWNNFDATDPADGYNPAIDDIGLYHPEAPSDGEQWYFTVARVETGGGLPAWESRPGAFFMADRPHGILEFGPRSNVTPCDLNDDSVCDAADIDALSIALFSGMTDPKFDIDGNGTIEDADRTQYVEVVLFTWIGDSNLDGEFSTLDLVEVFAVGAYEDGIDGNSGWAGGDWSGDLDFTTVDFVTAFASGGYEQGQRAQPLQAVSTVPEPAALALTLLGLLCLSPVVRQSSGTSRG
jgi:hypothetical protein